MFNNNLFISDKIILTTILASIITGAITLVVLILEGMISEIFQTKTDFVIIFGQLRILIFCIFGNLHTVNKIEINCFEKIVESADTVGLECQSDDTNKDKNVTALIEDKNFVLPGFNLKDQ